MADKVWVEVDTKRKKLKHRAYYFKPEKVPTVEIELKKGVKIPYGASVVKEGKNWVLKK